MAYRYAPIADYGMIGDCHSAALVHREGSIDWACLQRFDSGSIFGRLLDADRGGAFSLNPQKCIRTERRYIRNTNILETTFFTASGTARLWDCFTMRKGGRKHPFHQLLRILLGVSGEVEFDVVIEPRFDYGSLRPWLRYHEKERVYSAVGGNDAFVLTSECALTLDRKQVAWKAMVVLKKGQRSRFSLVSCLPHEMALERVPPRTIDQRLMSTKKWWRGWVSRGRYRSEAREQVIRSALTLKMLTCAPTGAIVAAPTTSLPERLRSERNWDYRYSWIRDSTLTLGALVSVGHPEVATGFKRFIERATAGSAEELQVMYGCYGERRLPEQELEYLEGYEESRPVRVGNKAATQRQLDVYGELMDAAILWHHAGNPINEDGWLFLRGIVNAACEHWKEPDQGLWETRGDPQHFVYSKAMCWLAVERGIQLGELSGHLVDLPRWREVRDEIRTEIETKGIDAERGCFVQAFGSRELDASLLRLPLIGFVAPNDARMRATVREVRAKLASDGLLIRYRTEAQADGLIPGEGAFLIVSFWLVDVLAMQGEIVEAEALFSRLSQLGNDLGLFSEEYDPHAGQLLGNFPQAFTHIALITSAEQLHRARSGQLARPIGERSMAHKPVRGTTSHHRCLKK